MTTPNLGLYELAGGIGQPHLLLNMNLKVIDFMLSRVVDSVLSYSDPSSLDVSVDGRTHIIGASPVGEWAGKYAYIASWLNVGGWRYIAPKLGMMMWSVNTGRIVVYVGNDSAYPAPWVPLE